MAEKRFKDAVRRALKSLLLPPLQELVCEYVQITSLSGTDAMTWRLVTTGVITIEPGSISVRGLQNNVLRPNTKYPRTIWTNWIGPKIQASFDASQVSRCASQIVKAARVVFTFSDSNNWSLDPEPRWPKKDSKMLSD
jgi:hypothetical protein